jgi:hypothetical protein
LPDSEEPNKLPLALQSEITSYTCECLDLTSETHNVPCLEGIDDRDFVYDPDELDRPTWKMQGNVLCDIDMVDACEVSSEGFSLRCDIEAPDGWLLEMNGSAGCAFVAVSPEAGFSCDPFDMTFIIPVSGCTGANPTPCEITFRIFET